METDFISIDRGVVYINERRRRQVFPECLFLVVFNSFQFYLWRQLTQKNHGIVESKEKRELCMHLPQQKYGRQRKLNYRYTSIPSVFSLAKQLNLLLKHWYCGHVTGWSCVEYSVWGQSRAVIRGQLLLFLTFSHKVIFNCIIQPIISWIKIARKIKFIGLAVQ